MTCQGLGKAWMRMDTDQYTCAGRHAARRQVSKLHDEGVGTVLHVTGNNVAVEVGVKHAYGLLLLQLSYQADPTAGTHTCLENIIVGHRHLAAHIAVEVVGDGILHGKGIGRKGCHIDIGDDDLLTVDVDLCTINARCAGIVDGDVHWQRAASQEGVAGIGDAALEAVGKLLFVVHQHTCTALWIGQGIYHLDAGILEIAVEISQ